jgi:hypothetical protein
LIYFKGFILYYTDLLEQGLFPLLIMTCAVNHSKRIYIILNADLLNIAIVNVLRARLLHVYISIYCLCRTELKFINYRFKYIKLSDDNKAVAPILYR